MQFNHVTLIVTDFERSKAFYGALGLVQIVDSPPRYARFRFPDGDATLSIEVTGGPAVASRAELFFDCASVDETVTALKAKGFAFDQEPTDISTSGEWRISAIRTATSCVFTARATTD
jgi:catechol 2,3-dioxygenase-like lactoylglutathione lyase family enzyme